MKIDIYKEYVSYIWWVQHKLTTTSTFLIWVFLILNGSCMNTPIYMSLGQGLFLYRLRPSIFLREIFVLVLNLNNFNKHQVQAFNHLLIYFYVTVMYREHKYSSSVVTFLKFKTPQKGIYIWIIQYQILTSTTERILMRIVWNLA